MMQTHSASPDEDIEGRKEKDAQDENEAGRPRQFCSPLLALSRPPHGTRSVPEVQRLTCGRGCSDLDDGGAPSSSLAHGEGGPLGSRCTTATCADRSAIQSGSKSYHSSREAPAPQSVPTIARCLGRTGGVVCSRRRSWMRIGTACATGGWRADELPSRVNIGLQLVSDLERDARFARAGCGSG
jgi:hypothetical protein